VTRESLLSEEEVSRAVTSTFFLADVQWSSKWQPAFEELCDQFVGSQGERLYL